MRAAIRAGYRHIDTAYLYNNQAFVGRAIAEAIAAGEVTRGDLFVTTKVAFFPAGADPSSIWVPIAFHPNNTKGLETTRAGIDECLALLGLDHVDLLLIHNPCTAPADYAASAAPHCGELSRSMLTAEERELILAHRLAKAHAARDAPFALASRAASWRALEEAREAGKARFIGVSNYPAPLMEEMAGYAQVAAAVNQLELHPRFSSPGLRALAAATGLRLTAYGSGNSAAIEKSPVVAAVAARRGLSATRVVLQWTLARGACVIPRTANVGHMEENWGAGSPSEAQQLTPGDLAELDALDEGHPYYWSPMLVCYPTPRPSHNNPSPQPAPVLTPPAPPKTPSRNRPLLPPGAQKDRRAQ